MKLFFLSYVELSLLFETLKFTSYRIILASTTSNLSKHATPIASIWKKQSITLKMWSTEACCITFSVFSSDNKLLFPIQSPNHLTGQSDDLKNCSLSGWCPVHLNPIRASVSPNGCIILDWISSWNRLLMSF